MILEFLFIYLFLKLPATGSVFLIIYTKIIIVKSLNATRIV